MVSTFYCVRLTISNKYNGLYRLWIDGNINVITYHLGTFPKAVVASPNSEM